MLKARAKAHAILTVGFVCVGAPDLYSQELYRQTGTDPAWATIIEDKLIPIGTNSNAGIIGSIIDVNNAVVEQCTYGKNPIPWQIQLHTPGSSAIGRSDFAKWSRWYQEDGHTQVFRLFKGEYNVRNTRPLAARSETFSDLSWDKGAWHEWVGTYTFVKPIGGAIFQVKNNGEDWSVQLLSASNGDVWVHDRQGKKKLIATNMTGKSFDIKVRDNGLDFEVYLNGAIQMSGSYARPSGGSKFRWGCYVGETQVQNDFLMFVTGAAIDSKFVTGLSASGKMHGLAKGAQGSWGRVDGLGRRCR